MKSLARIGLLAGALEAGCMPEVPMPKAPSQHLNATQAITQQVQAEVGVTATVVRPQGEQRCEGIITQMTVADPYPESVSVCVPKKVVEQCGGYANTLVADPSGIVEACWAPGIVSGYEEIEQFCDRNYNAGVTLHAHKCVGQEILMWTCDSKDFPEAPCWGF